MKHARDITRLNPIPAKVDCSGGFLDWVCAQYAWKSEHPVSDGPTRPVLVEAALRAFLGSK